ncbi:PP2C family protein-serine/threonine phosphatase [Methyloversatilis sp.]|uniref:PP2C family protein-serine/threonine phosphatase n=1 Tax=Methyloversatilis sp. TaxID=2569862 RepID=UPI0027360F79|nr:SpoIIE family protein phosphatase [Methyloversatilis sp.]MDP2869270.1 SpoIIE family protein phosphatase [Methyloversatilis sp.]MDP3457310.1 SpoIIE family protein phosphatase [Methyloversatilis sp.]MDP3577048.1 SpoIIE family protein phosphatase [Methyloversatilis sp.]
MQANPEDMTLSVGQQPVRQMTVLVVDDTLIGRATVSALVRRLGYRCIEASDGAAALQAFRSARPDIVLMDVVMPGMDGLEATRELRRLCAGIWLPILLLSARSDDDDMIAGLEAGADDYLSKPIRRAILAAKLSACARQLALQADMNNYRAEQEAEIEFARGVIERQVQGKAVSDPRVRYSVTPTTQFSGDIVAVSRAPSGALYALLADATGHGLAAAISVLPVLQVFFGMAAKNLSLGLMAGEINRHLMSSLPIGRFVAASMVRLDEGFGELWVGGTPEVLWLDRSGAVRERFASANLPLGIDADDPLNVPPRHFRWTPGDQLVLCSDGLLEAHAPSGDAFGSARLERLLGDNPPAHRHDAVRRALDVHLDGASAHDDVSLLVIDLD